MPGFEEAAERTAMEAAARVSGLEKEAEELDLEEAALLPGLEGAHEESFLRGSFLVPGTEEAVLLSELEGLGLISGLEEAVKLSHLEEIHELLTIFMSLSGPEREDVVSHISFDFLTSWLDCKCMLVPGSSEICSGSGSETGLTGDSTPEGWIMFSLGLVTGSVIILKVGSFSELRTSLGSEIFCCCLKIFPGSVTRFRLELFILSSP